MIDNVLVSSSISSLEDFTRPGHSESSSCCDEGVGLMEGNGRGEGEGKGKEKRKGGKDGKEIKNKKPPK